MRLKSLQLTVLMLLFCALACAQTLQEGRNLFSAGNYEAALPIMEKYSRQQPSNATRSYWYGVCLFETGRRADAVPYLEQAVAKKIIKGHRYLAEYYADQMEYQQAIDHYELLVEGMEKDKELHNDSLEAVYRTKSEKLRKSFRMLRNTSRICFIDSFAVSKDNFLSSYILSSQTGSIAKYSDIFGTGLDGDVFIPETKSDILFSRLDADSTYRTYKGFRSFDEWTDITRVELISGNADVRYPFVMNDGATTYFASNGPESIGGYDIFVTRYNTGTGAYLTPENIGMPFNSPANDYMYVIDEASNLGWFATDRNQSPDSVCVYVFIPNETRSVYSIESDGDTAVIRAARLASIAETQSDKDALRAARQRLTMLALNGLEKDSEHGITFVIDDMTDYHAADEFRCPEARTLFESWTKARKKLESDSANLLQQREVWNRSSISEREKTRASLLQFEKEVGQLERYVSDTEVEIRNLEIRYLTR